MDTQDTTSTERWKKQLLNFLCAVPQTETFQVRTQLLHGVEGGEQIQRSEHSRRVDLWSMVDGLCRLHYADPAPLRTLIDNAIHHAGERTSIAQDLNGLRQQMPLRFPQPSAIDALGGGGRLRYVSFVVLVAALVSFSWGAVALRPHLPWTKDSLRERVALTNPWKRVSESLDVQEHEIAWSEFDEWHNLRGGASVVSGHGRDHPATDVSYDDAARFCQDIGGRLPTAAEWRGVLGGDLEWTRRVAPDDAPRPVKANTTDVVPSNRVRDMVGSVSEWVVADGLRETEHLAMGGRSGVPDAHRVLYLSEGSAHLGPRPDVGFRCVRDAQPPPPRASAHCGRSTP